MSHYNLPDDSGHFDQFGGAHKINNTIGQVLLAKRLGESRIIAETGAG